MNGTRVDTEDIHHLQSYRENNEGAWAERGGGGQEMNVFQYQLSQRTYSAMKPTIHVHTVSTRT